MMNMGKVSILLSVFKPNLEYLKLQLLSIAKQDYINKEVLIWDDDPDSTIDVDWIENVLGKITVVYKKAEKNLGYIKAFEYLTSIATGKYVAFCDQDDLWKKNKLSVCVENIKARHCVMVASDYEIIDGRGTVVMSSARKNIPSVGNSWNTGDDITLRALTECMAVGMTMVLERKCAQKAIPFSKHTGHDKWLAICASAEGRVCYVEQVLVSYRRHGKNTTGILAGITSKQDYFAQRVQPSYELAWEFARKYPDNLHKEEVLQFADARRKGKIRVLWKYRKISPMKVYFEIMMKFVPEWIFELGMKRMGGILLKYFVVFF